MAIAGKSANFVDGSDSCNYDIVRLVGELCLYSQSNWICTCNGQSQRGSTNNTIFQLYILFIVENRTVFLFNIRHSMATRRLSNEPLPFVQRCVRTTQNYRRRNFEQI